MPGPLWPLRIRHDEDVSTTVATAVAVGLTFGLLCAAGHLLRTGGDGMSTFWPADGVLTAVLLCRPRNRWWMFLLFAWLADIAYFNLAFKHAFGMGVYMAACHSVDVLVAALLMQRAFQRDREPDMASPEMMRRFLWAAVLVAPAITSALAATYYLGAEGTSFDYMFIRWFLPKALGMAIMVPLTLVLGNTRTAEMFKRPRILKTLGTFLLTLVAAVIIFQMTTYSLVFLVLPLLMLVVSEVGIPGAVIVTFEILLVGALFTLHHHGPFWISPHATIQSSVFFLQAAILTLLMCVVPFATTLERQRELRFRLQLGMQRYQMLADNSRDIVVLTNFDGRRLHVSPAVEEVLGWTRVEWLGQETVEFMHPEDRGAFQRMIKEMQNGADRRTFRYRTRHKNGKYIWMEANIRAVPQTLSGEPAAFVANLRDVSERMETEKKLAAAHEHVQQQAQRDSLTQLANRRCFDEALEREWRRGRRVGNPLTLLMVDIDHFKKINDNYGHRVGDQCLQGLAAVLCRMARRPNDLVARYGGEEFAVLLPDVNLARATIMAEALCLKVRQYMFEAGVGSPMSLTVSIGVAAQVPSKTTRGDGLVEAADRALYDAKRAGRNCIMPVSADEEFPMIFQQLQM